MKKYAVLLLGLTLIRGLYAANYTLSYSESYNVMSSTGSRADVNGISPLSYSGGVVIPSSYKKINETFMVMGISSGAFTGSNLTELKIPSEIMQIKSLGTCSSLKRIIIEKKSFKCSYNGNTYFSESAFSGSHADCVIFVPKGFYRSDHMNPGLYDGESYWKYTYLKPGELFGGRPIEWFHYHVKFNANGGSGTMPEQTIYTDETTNLTANAFTRSGYKFSGWATSASGGIAYSDKASVKNLDTSINVTVNLYAVWAANNYSVKFNANGGSGTMSNQSFAYGEAKNLTANAFTRTGYTFQGWATSASGTKVYSDKQSVKNLTSSNNGTVNLYAVWEKVQSEFSDSDTTINGYSGKYDGLAHGVVATSEISGFKVRYSATKEGSFEVVSPTIKDVGSMIVWCELSAPDYVTITNSATVTIKPREVTLTSGSASKVYDGTALENGNVVVGGDGFVSGEGVNFAITGSQTSAGSSENTFAYTFKDGTKPANYTITTQTGMLTVTAASIGGGTSGGEELGNGVVPQGGLSKFDTTVMYDGKAHTIDTNALVAALGRAINSEFRVLWACDFESFNEGDTIIDVRDATRNVISSDSLDGIAEIHNHYSSESLKSLAGSAGERFLAFDIDSAEQIWVAPEPVAGDKFSGRYRPSYGKSISVDFLAQMTATTEMPNISFGMPEVIDEQVQFGRRIFSPDSELVLVVTCVGSVVRLDDKIAVGIIEFEEDERSSYNWYACVGVVGELGEIEERNVILEAAEKQSGATLPCSPDEWSQITIKAVNDGDDAGIGFSIYINGIRAAANGVDVFRALPSAVDRTGISGMNFFGKGAIDNILFWTDELRDSQGVYDNPELMPTLTYALTEDGPWQSIPFVYTNVCTTSFWYKISAENYQDYIHEARVTITKRPITITSGNGTWVYDGLPHSNTTVTIDGLVDGDGVETKNFATITEVGTEANSFDYEFSDGTLASNYAVTCVAGQLSVVAANMDDWVDDSKWSVTLTGNNAKYDGTEKVSTVSALSYDGIAILTFAVTGNTATDAGNYTLTVAGTGNYSGTHAFEWSILPREVALTSGSATKVYDGTALVNGNVVIGGDGFVSGEGATYNVTGSQTSVGSSENSFTYTLQNGTKAENYTITTQTGLLTVTAASIGGGAFGGEEPGGGIVPQGGLSKFDTSVMYDGKAHTIDTNALLAVTLAGSTPEFSYALTEDGPWQSMPFVYTNVCTTSFWYKISAENYQDYIHEARLTISPRTGVVVDIVGSVATNMFDNAQQTVSGYQVSINDPLYSESDFEFAGSDTISKIAAGVYPMGLSSTQFVNTNVNFAEVAFNVTDGELVILAPSEKNVVFDALGGFSGDGKSVVTQRCDAVYGEMPVVTREGYCFEGWYLGVTNAAPEAIARSELLVDDAHTLFARWRIDESVMSGGETVFKWEVISSDAVRILGFENSSQMVEVLVLPDTIEGMPVAEIAVGAFANSKCGMRKLILPIFCTKIGDKAFNGVSSLAEVNFADVRQWNAPSLAAELAIGRYAFSGASVAALRLPASVEEIGDYAFANCKEMSSITILGQPAIGLMPLRRSGMNTGGVVVHLDPALANDGVYMDSLKQGCASVTVRADAVVNSIELSSLSLAADEVSLLVSVEKAASWGSIDSSAIKVSFRASLSDEPIMLDPILVVENDDGSLTVKVASPGGESGFFQVVYLK